MRTKERNKRYFQKDKYRPRGYYLPDGSHILINGTPKIQTITALGEMIKLAKKLK